MCKLIEGELARAKAQLQASSRKDMQKVLLGGVALGLVAALVLLNVSLTFTNIWPTLGIRLNADLSVETALCVLGLVLVRRWRGGPSRVALRWLAGLWILLGVGRYAAVTVPSLYGRRSEEPTAQPHSPD